MYSLFVRLWVCMFALLVVGTVQAKTLAASAHTTTVQKVRLWRGTDYTRVVLDLDAAVQHSLTLANNPNRIILNIPNTTLATSLNGLALTGTPVDIMRSATINKNDLRLVFDLNKNVSPKSFLLKKQAGNNDRLVIDLYDAVGPYTAITPQKATANTTANTTANKNSTHVSAANLAEASSIEELVASEPKPFVQPKASSNLAGKRAILITVDAGHGGQDTGALGPNNLREKDITLAIAHELVSAINAQAGFTARLTRANDVFIPLQKRRDLARDMKADLFVSIHADAFTDPAAKGASVFALSRKGASSETARFLAQHENESDLVGGVGGVSLEDKDVVLAGVLVDLSMTATVNSSLQIGSSVLNSIAAMAPLHTAHVEQAGFVVLKSPDVPSILVETGFISNKDESRKLASVGYRTQIAQSVFSGIRKHFMLNPPAGTYLAAGVQNENSMVLEREHRVVRGDTLAYIASRYNVNSNQLVKYNGLKSVTVKVGQTLKIPAS